MRPGDVQAPAERGPGPWGAPGPLAASPPRPRQPPQPGGLCVERGVSFLSERPQPFSLGVSSSPASSTLQTPGRSPCPRPGLLGEGDGPGPHCGRGCEEGNRAEGGPWGRVGDPTENRPRKGASHSFRLHGPRTPG